MVKSQYAFVRRVCTLVFPVQTRHRHTSLNKKYDFTRKRYIIRWVMVPGTQSHNVAAICVCIQSMRFWTLCPVQARHRTSLVVMVMVAASVDSSFVYTCSNNIINSQLYSGNWTAKQLWPKTIVVNFAIKVTQKWRLMWHIHKTWKHKQKEVTLGDMS